MITKTDIHSKVAAELRDEMAILEETIDAAIKEQYKIDMTTNPKMCVIVEVSRYSMKAISLISNAYTRAGWKITVENQPNSKILTLS